MLTAGAFRPRTVAAVAVAAVAAVVAISLYAGLAEAGPTKRLAGHRFAKDVSCELNLVAVLPPRTIKAENFGTVVCDDVFGEGVQHDSSTVTPVSQYSGHFTGPVKQFFDGGTVGGTFTMKYTTDPTTLAVTYAGTIEITNGTGRYKHMRGTGTLTGTSPDAIHTKIHEELNLKKR